MVLLAFVPLVMLTGIALAATGVIRVKWVQGWPRDARRALLAGVIAVGLVLYLHHGTYCVAISPDGQFSAGVRYNGLLLRAGVEDAVVVVEGVGSDGPFVAVRQRLSSAHGRPTRLAWHPDGRRLACVQQRDGASPHCSLVRVMPRVAALCRAQATRMVGP